MKKPNYKTVEELRKANNIIEDFNKLDIEDVIELIEYETDRELSKEDKEQIAFMGLTNFYIFQMYAGL